MNKMSEEEIEQCRKEINNVQMRDAFIERVKENMKFDKDIYFLSADFGALCS